MRQFINKSSVSQRTLAILLLVLLWLPFMLQAVPSATAQPSTCGELVEQALVRVEQACGGLSRGEACYGNNSILATLLPGRETEFDAPADLVPVQDLQSLRTLPLDTATETWGVAVLNVRANLPDTLPGQGVIVMVYGDTTLTDAGGESPMQAVYFTSGIGQSNCRELPPTALVIQSPQGYVVDITVNGVDVRMGSTVAFETTEGGMRLTTFEGGASMRVGSFHQVIPTGFVSEVPLEENAEGGFEPAGAPSAPELYDVEAWQPLEDFSEAIFAEEIDVPETAYEDLEAYCADPANAEVCANPLVFDNVCGDAVCGADEYCPEDCGAADYTCGDGFCDPIYLGEDAQSCAEDCGVPANFCGDYVCDSFSGEDAANCAFDCAAQSRGEAICGDLICDGGAGEDAGLCPADCAAPPTEESGTPRDGNAPGDGQTVPSGFCGDAICDGSLGEDQNTCTADCGAAPSASGFCGDAICDGGLGEDQNTCTADCGSPAPPDQGDGGGGQSGGEQGGGGQGGEPQLEQPAEQPAPECEDC